MLRNSDSNVFEAGWRKSAFDRQCKVTHAIKIGKYLFLSIFYLKNVIGVIKNWYMCGPAVLKWQFDRTMACHVTFAQKNITIAT